MHRNIKKTGFIIVVLIAALLLPGWMVVQSLSVFPTDRQTVSGESSALKSRLADSQFGLNKQDPSTALLVGRSSGIATKATTTVPVTTLESTITLSTSETSIPSDMLATTVPTTATETTATGDQAPTTELTTTAAATPTTEPTAMTVTIPTTAPTVTAAPTPTTAPTTTAIATPTTAPTTTAPTTPPTADPATVNYWQSEILRLTNEERAKVGLPALKAAATGLSGAAATRASEISIAGSFSHTRPDGSNWFTAITQNGVSFRTAGENIAYCTSGSLTPVGVMSLWMNSDGHRKNILNNGTPPYTTLGVGYCKNNGKDYFVQLFIG